jgi:hypothetical protein
MSVDREAASYNGNPAAFPESAAETNPTGDEDEDEGVAHVLVAPDAADQVGDEAAVPPLPKAAVLPEIAQEEAPQGDGRTEEDEDAT